jgi:hypothetical protein
VAVRVVGRALSSGLGLLAIVAACSGRTSSKEPEPPLTAERLPAAAARQICDVLSQCCEARAFELDHGACQLAVTEAFQAMVEDLATPNAQFDAQDAQSCIDDFSDRLCARHARRRV